MTAAVAGPFAAAEHLLLTGRYGEAVVKPTQAYRAA